MPTLHFTDGDQTMFVHLLRPGRTVFGRSDSCDVALPSDELSRTHCIVEQRASGWLVVDRSRNGTFVNGERADKPTPLREGDVLTIGPYAARFAATIERSGDQTTVTMQAVPAPHEELVEVTDASVATARAELVFVRGPRQGESFVLRRMVTSLGGPGADLVLDDTLPERGVLVRVVRGRVMVEPVEAGAWLAGQKVRQITPALKGEELRVGEHAMIVGVRTESEPAGERSSFGAMVGQSSPMRKLFAVLSRMAAHDMPVLLNGESGTGKELAARGLHLSGLRATEPFVAINCAAIAEQLFESELFGHEKGSFTGATERQAGAFQRADGGTLFLDEVGELKLEHQAKLLRALESGEVRRVGGAKPEFPDVRVIAATNRTLPHMVQKGTFREDLYFRLSVLTVRIPPLRERRSDIPVIARALLDRNHPGVQLSPEAEGALVQYDWPGNVRELRNVLTRAFVVSGGQVIGPGDLVFNPWSFAEASAPSEPEPQPVPGEDPERRQIREALDRHQGNRTQAARELGIARSSLLYRMKRLGLT